MRRIPMEILRSGQLFVLQVRTSTRTPLVSVLLHDPSGSEKTALAAPIKYHNTLSDDPTMVSGEMREVLLSTRATTRVAASSSILTEIGLSEVFESKPRVPRQPNLSTESLFALNEERRQAIRMLEGAMPAPTLKEEDSLRMHIGIKKLLSTTEMAG
ncbi:transport between ER and Golgi ATPase protein [Stygiomarasmius scandens]|uniref:Transport between ER and Golgi ATPase protein n=1 Tax=Marasmiellus scandens TaxID=2682957 RepID=A0ABR1K2A7_9AGAR